MLFRKKPKADEYHEMKSEYELGYLNGYTLNSVMKFNKDKSMLFSPFGKQQLVKLSINNEDKFVEEAKYPKNPE